MLLGRRMRCIACSTVFVASPDLGSPPPPVADRQPSYPLHPQEEPAPPPAPVDIRHGLSRLRLPLCPSCHRPVSWEDLDCPHCGHLFDPLDAGGRGDWSFRRDADAHRGKLIDTLGSISLLSGVLALCGVGMVVALATGIPALVMAGNDLERMRQGTMDQQGRLVTEWGRNKAIGGVVIGLLLGLVGLLFLLEWLR
jgi:hypothetical protein